MSKHQVVIHENTGATKESAPYLGSYIAKETMKEVDFANILATLCGMSAVQAMAILDGAFEAIEELEREGLVRVHTDIGTICGIITGSFPTADAAFDKDRNALELTLRLDEEIRLALVDVVPTIAQDESLTKLRVDNVMDLETSRPYNLIHGQGIFRVAGFNMVLEDEGATVYLTDRKGITFDVVVDEVLSKQLFKGHTAALLEPGDYKLVVKSRAGDAEGPLQTAFRKVKYLKTEPPMRRGKLINLSTSDADAPDELSVDDGVKLMFDKVDPDGGTGHVIVNGIEQPAPVTVTETEPWVMWTWGEDLVGQRVTFGFRYEDGTEAGEVMKTIRARR